jgi:hypothetical protein
MELETLLGDLLERQGDTFNVSAAFEASVANEATARANADTALGVDIATEATARANADTALQTAVDAKVSVAGQIGGTATSPDVRGIRETSGPTLLTVGEIADGALCKRVGSTVVGVLFSDLQPLQPYYAPIGLTEVNTAVTQTSGRAYAWYIGVFAAGTIIDNVTLEQTTAAAGAGQGEVAIASSAAAPGLNTESNLTILAAGLVSDMTVPNTVKINTTPFNHTLAAKTHLWAVTRSSFVTTQPTLRHASRMRQFVACQFKNSVADLTTLVGTTLNTWAVSSSAPVLTVMPRL